MSRPSSGNGRVPKLMVDDVSADYGTLPVLSRISLDLSPGEFVSIIGPSGCGKSTLLRISAGLESPGSGRILVDGIDMTGKSGRVSHMHQKDLLLPWKTVTGNASIPLVLSGIDRDDAAARVEALLGEFGLEGFGGYYPHQLSGGMRQRAALLRTYLFAGDLLLLDEPFGALDAITRRSMQKWLLSVIEEHGSTVLLVTHDVEEAVLLSDRVAVMSSAPGSVKEFVEIGMPHPRESSFDTGSAFVDRRNRLLALIGREITRGG